MSDPSPAPEVLAAWVDDACRRTIELVADLEADQLIGPVLPIVNPLLWELGHVAWFQEKFVLRQSCGEPPLLGDADALYDSGAIPHGTRWHLKLPSRAVTVDYLRRVAERVADRVLNPDATDVVHHFARYTVHHTDSHTEAITHTRQTLGLPPPVLPGLTDTAGGPGVDAGPLPGDVRVEGGVLLLGAVRRDPFVCDNEKWAHPVRIAPFAIARAPVTQAELAAFVDDGGYEDPRLWSDHGAWLAATGARHPVYWRRGPHGWERRHFDAWVALEPHLPASHVCWWEADAYCRWAHRRLPTEAEWELASAGPARPKAIYPWGDPPTVENAATDWRTQGPVPVNAFAGGDGPTGCRQLIGNVWEWTASDFCAYPGFEPDAYRDNSEPFFGRRKVLRGGAWATRLRCVRNTYRNYFTPDRRDVIAGFRTCARES